MRPRRREAALFHQTLNFLQFPVLQELAIARRTQRQSTVIAKETVELLSIDAQVVLTTNTILLPVHSVAFSR